MSTIHFSESDAHQQLVERTYARGLEFLSGQIGEATFLRSLLIYGYDIASAKHELWKLQQQDNGL
jgi:hypothetical protein